MPGGGGGGGAPWDPRTQKSMGAKKGGVKILCVAAELKNRGQKSICGHKKGGQYSMSHWKIGVKILWKLKYGGQNSIFFSWNPWSKFYVPWKGGVKILYFFPVPWKRGVKTAEPTNQLHWRGAPPPGASGDHCGDHWVLSTVARESVAQVWG